VNIPDRPPLAGPALPLLHLGRIERVVVLTLCADGGNRMTGALVAALDQAVTAALADPQVQALVLAAEGSFCSGPADELPPPSPDAAAVPATIAALAALCDTIEHAAKPVIAALTGQVASGGLALALACHARVAEAGCSLSLPEGRLALLPPGNAAVRLAWRGGADAAVRLLSGAALPAPEALVAGLLDQVTDGPPLAQAVALANAPCPRPPDGMADPAAFRAALNAARARLPQPLPAHRSAEGWALDSVEAAQLLPPDQALAFDLARAEDAARRPEARAAAHLARIRRRLLAEPAPAPLAPLLAALGPEAAGRLLPRLLRAGHSVILHAPDRDTLSASLESVAETQLAEVRAGHLTEAQAEADWQRISGRLTPEAAYGPGLADREHAVWLAEAAPHAAPLVLWADAAQSRDLPDLPQALLAIPAPTRPARLCELISAPGTPPQAIDEAAGLLRALGHLPLRCRGASSLTAMIRTAARTAARLRALGVPSQTLAETAILPPGLAAGAPAPERTPLPLPVERLILLALVNQGARLLAEGVARHPGDLDLAMVLGAGWPEGRGGPMAEADAIGPLVLRHESLAAEHLDPGLWAPAPLLSEMIRHGWRFETLNRA